MPGPAAATNSREVHRRRPPQLRRLQHIVVLMQENRSYDHYFGALARSRQSASKAAPTTGDPNPGDPSAKIALFHQQSNCEVDDLTHSRTGALAHIDSR